MTSESHDESHKEVAFLPNLQYCVLLLPVVQMLYISINSCSLNTITQTKFMNRHMCHKARQHRLRKPALLTVGHQECGVNLYKTSAGSMMASPSINQCLSPLIARNMPYSFVCLTEAEIKEKTRTMHQRCLDVIEANGMETKW